MTKGSMAAKEAAIEDDMGEDAFENYFENQMMQDMQGIEEYEQQIDYFEALKKVEAKVAKSGGAT